MNCSIQNSGYITISNGIKSEITIERGTIPVDSKAKRKLFTEDSNDENSLTSFSQNYQNPSAEYPKRIIIGNGISQIAIRKKYNDSPTGLKNNEVVLLNGNWETSNGIPNIVAEMHNVNLAELQNTWGTDEPLTAKTGDKNIHLEQINQCSSQSENLQDNQQDYNISDDSFSWLVNFKLDEFIHAATPTSTTVSGIPNSEKSLSSNRYPPQKYTHVYVQADRQYYSHNKSTPGGGQTITMHPQQPAPVVGPGGDMLHSGVPVHRYGGPRKPPFTYTELIEQALHEKGELTVSGIYQWISDHFPFYKANDDRWKNSVRHNLSINPHFRKGSKAVHGAGHLWTIASKPDDRKMSSYLLKKQRMQTFMEIYNEQERAMEDELQAATASILPDMDHVHLLHNGQKHLQNGMRSLEKTAEEILEGVKREVEVQYLVPINNSMDFMNPVPKEEVAEECGLRSDKLTELAEGDYLITDLNPQALGLNLTEAEIITPDQLFGDDLNFQCYELQT